MRTYSTFLLILSLVFTDVFLVLDFGFVHAPEVEAATGDFSVFRESGGGEVVTSSGFDVTWDTTVSESSNIALAGNTSDITLTDGGKYLVLYNTFLEEGSSGGGNRRSAASYLTLDGSQLEYGWGGGYIRDAESDVTMYNSGAAIIDATANQDLAVAVVRDDANAGGGTEIRDATNGISVLKLDDSLDYLRIHKSTRSSDISANTAFTDVEWDTSDEVDTGSFDFTPSSANVTLKGEDGKFFLVTTNVKLNVDGTGGPRQNYEMRLTLDGAEIPGTRSNTYLRFDNGVINGTMQYVGIIQKTSSGDQTFNVEVRREGEASASTDIVGDETALSIVALPSSAEVLSLTNSTNQTLTAAQSVLTWDTQESSASTYFTHSTTSNTDNIEIASDGDYLFFASTYTSRSTGTGRDVPKIDWQIDSSIQNYGGHGSFNRGDQGGEDTYTSGASSGAIFPGLTSGQIVELVQSDETTGTPVSVFEANRFALQAVEISTLLAEATTDVSVSGAQPATSAPSVNNFSLGEQFVVIENSTSRNITSITFTETGTIDAASNVSNVRLYYDLDTSLPYDCSDESYSGGESQLGATSSFSGANGSVSFSGSVSISPTQAFCGYVFLDIGEGASDGEVLNVVLEDASVDVVVTAGGTVNPPTTLGSSFTTIEDAEITQTGYHWREDDGNETGASSATAGDENTPGLSFSTTTPQRLRIGVAAQGTGNETNNYRLEFAEKVTTCSVATGWTDVGAVGGAWDMFDSSFLAEGADTTNISVGSGGVTDGGDIFVTPNGGVRDASSQTGAIDLNGSIQTVVGEVGTSLLSNGVTTTINLSNTFTDPIIVASARYPRTGTQRTTRISAKSASSFDVIVDNYDGSLAAGNSTIDYVVMEAGEWTLDDGGSGTKVFASSTNTSVVDGQTLVDNPGGGVITYPSSFTNPAVLASLVSSNDPEWAFAQVYDGTNLDNPPSGTSLTAFINDNHDSDGHGAAEDIDVIVFEEGSGTNSGNDFGFTSTGVLVTNTPVSVGYGTTYGSAPAVIVLQAMTQLGTDGGFAQVDENTTPTGSGVTISTDEDGLGADRTHAAEDVAVISFASAGLLFTNDVNQSEFTELEYSVQATSNATEGVAYCFRVTDAGTPLRNYTEYPEATLNADVTVSATGTQAASVDAGTTDFAVGGVFSVLSNNASRTVTDITVTETGTIDASIHLSNPQLAYEFDTSAPYNCVSESYGGGETTVSGLAFAEANGSSTFSFSEEISETQALCAYVLVDVSSTSTDGETIEFEITLPNADVLVTSSSVGPGSTIALDGTTLVNAPSLTQANYHWRNDNGDEAGATSATGGTENTLVSNVFQGVTQRLRLAVSNDGNVSASDVNLRLEYGTRVTTCENVGSWQRVSDGVAFNMASSSQLVEGNDTTNISVGNGGVSDPNTTFITSNAGQKEDSDQVATATLASTEFIEVEYAIEVTDASAFGATYCFRVTDEGEELSAYTNFAELTVQDRQDFFIQRGTETVSGTGVTLTAGTDYVAPGSSSSAFVRITNTSMTGAGSDTLGQTRTPDELTAYILDPTNLETSFTITRPAGVDDNTRVSWEIIEYVGVVGADNEMIVRDAGVVTYGGSDLFATGTSVSGISDDSDVVVFITGQLNPAGSTADYNTGLSVSSWSSGTDEPVFERGDADGITAGVSYAVVEFTGASWNVQRVEHTFTAAGVAEQESITAVNSLSRTFVHAQKLSGDELFNLDESGHEVWLSSIGAVSFQLESGSTNPSDQRSVAWVIESTQTGDGAMAVYRSNGLIAATTGQPNVYVYSIGATVTPENASIWATNRSTGGGSAHPRALLGARILDATQFELWKSDEGQNQNFRVEVVEWPVAETSIRQAFYRFYVDNDALTPIDPWPAGVSDLGENTAMTDLDEPLGEGERTRIRTALFVNNASLVADSVSFKLQYGRRVTTCSAVSVWDDVGAPASGEIWRGFDGNPIDGTELASTSLLISVSDVAGTYEENNPSAVNPNNVDLAEYIEYDWVVENNGALQKNSYCFRMVESDGAELDGYDVYPTVRTSGYTPIIDNWRWFNDETNLTPTSPLAGERVAVSDVSVGEVLKLRVSVPEIEGASGENIKFNLQYSEFDDFRDGGTTLTSTSSCSGNSLWCYADGAGDDNDILSSTTLSGIDSCVAGIGDGCGTRNEAEGLTSSYDQSAFAVAEHEFTLRHDGARANAVYYFRLVDATNGTDLLASSSYPSLQTEGAVLTFSVSGVDAATTIDGYVTDATSTATDVDFGSLPPDTDVETAQRLTVFTNGTEGYRVFMEFSQDLTDSYGNTINSIPATNASPVSWSTVCTGASSSCFGYHAADDTLYDGSTRFAPDDSFAGVESGLVEVMASNVPVTFDVSEIVYRARVDILQPAGDYTANVTYIVVPIF